MYDTPFHQSLRITTQLTMLAGAFLLLAFVQVNHSANRLQKYKDRKIYVSRFEQNPLQRRAAFNFQTFQKKQHICKGESNLAKAQVATALIGIAFGIGLLLIIILKSRIRDHQHFQSFNGPTPGIFSFINVTKRTHSIISAVLLVSIPVLVILPLFAPSQDGDFFWYGKYLKTFPHWCLPAIPIVGYLFAKGGNSPRVKRLAQITCYLAILPLILFILALILFALPDTFTL